MQRIASLSLIAALSAAGSASAATINLTQLDLNGSFSSSAGTTVAHTNTVDGTSVSNTLSFTVNDLDITGDSTANDSVTFSFDVTATGGNVGLVGGTVFSIGVDGPSDAADNEIDPGEGLTFDNLTAVATFGDPTTDVLSIDSAVFNGFAWRFIGGDNGETVSVAIDGGQFTQPLGGGGQNSTFDVAPTAFTIGGGADGSNGFGIDTISATFELSAVPEPGSLALLGLGGLMVASRRRRA